MNTFKIRAIALRSPRTTAIAVAAALSLGACGGGSDEPAGFFVGGTVTGLTAAGLVLTNNGNDELQLALGAASFEFKKAVNAGAPYQVAVKSQPNGLACTIGNSSGNANADVNNVLVACEPSSTGPVPGPDPEPGGGTTSGNAAECFNPALLQVGTKYQWDMEGQVNGITVTMTDKAEVVASNSSFNGASGLIKTNQELSIVGNGLPAINQNNQVFTGLIGTPSSPVIVEHGVISEGSAIGVGAINIRTEYLPPAEVRDFTLAAGQSYAYRANVQSTVSMSGITQTVNDVDSYTTTFKGIKQITIPAGTFAACHFESQTSDGPFDHYVAKGSGLPLVISSVSDGERVTLRMLGSSNINGISVANYHAAQ